LLLSSAPGLRGFDSPRKLCCISQDGLCRHELERVVMSDRTKLTLASLTVMMLLYRIGFPLSVLLFFFFLAEDGIRVATVTGVQTCALPISTPAPRLCSPRSCRSIPRTSSPSGCCPRSEERRVGKECRSRWSSDH